MKKIIFAAALSGFATASPAGAPADPIVEYEVVFVRANETSGGIVLPLILLAVLVAAASD